MKLTAKPIATHCHASGLALPSRQHGVVIVIALIVLAAMALAGVALVRSMDTSTLVAGNFAFRQSAVQATDAGVEGAFTDLTTVVITNKKQDGDATATWYYPKVTTLMGTAESKDPDFFGLADAKYKSLAASTISGNTVRYLAERLCTRTITGAAAEADQTINGGDADGVASDQEVMNVCSHESSREGCSYSTDADCRPRLKSIYYKVTVKVTGPRNTASYAQSVLSYPANP